METLDKQKLLEWLKEHLDYYRKSSADAESDGEMLYAVGLMDSISMLNYEIDKGTFNTYPAN